MGLVVDEAHAVVREDDGALLLGGVEVDVCPDAKVAVVVAVAEDLVDVPSVAALLARGALVLLVNGVVGGAAGVCVQEDVLVLLVEAVEGLAPDGRPPAPVRV